MARREIVSPTDPAVNGDPAAFPYGANEAPPDPATADGLPPPASAAGDAPDPFDVQRLRLAQSADAALGVQEVLLRVPYRKPSKEVFFRVHPSAEYRVCGGVIELKDDDADTYWVDPSLWPALADEPTFSPRAVFTCVTRQGLLFLWGCRLPGPDGKVPDWVSIPLEAAKQAETAWTKIFWDQQQRRHRVQTAPALADEPRWPGQPFRELLRLAFVDRVITGLDHPLLRRLRGEV